MNEKIRALAEQAGMRFTMLTSNPMIPFVDGRQQDLEKFAELIVKECVDTIMNDTDRHRKEYFAGLLKEHFGVE